MKRVIPALLLISYSVVFWFSADAVAPLGLLAPYVLLGGGVVSVMSIAAVTGILGAAVACVALWKKKDRWSVVAAMFLGASSILFIVNSSHSLLSLVTALPLVATVGFALGRLRTTNEKTA